MTSTTLAPVNKSAEQQPSPMHQRQCSSESSIRIARHAVTERLCDRPLVPAFGKHHCSACQAPS
jgi:hypothetical protein